MPTNTLVTEIVAGEEYSFYPLGEYIVQAPGVCDGRPTFKYTRIEPRHILERMRNGDSVEDIASDYGGRVPRAAIKEAIQISSNGKPGPTAA